MLLKLNRIIHKNNNKSNTNSLWATPCSGVVERYGGTPTSEFFLSKLDLANSQSVSFDTWEYIQTIEKFK